MKPKNCNQCAHFEGGQNQCCMGHKPTFHSPAVATSADDFGCKRDCADFAQMENTEGSYPFPTMLYVGGTQQVSVGDRYGDGNVYRGVRSKDSRTWEVTEVGLLQLEITRLRTELEAARLEALSNALVDALRMEECSSFHTQMQTYAAQAQRLAMELECLLLSCTDTCATAKWWDSAHAALEEWRGVLKDHIPDAGKMMEGGEK